MLFEKNIPIYISLTSIFQNQEILLETLISLLNQKLLPDKIFIYLSIEPFLKDIGFSDKEITNEQLKELLSKNENKIIINWTENTGPYRKLLPLLKEKWNDDCIIITVDDDTVYNENLIENFYNEYCKYKCLISNRGFTPKLIDNNLETFDYYAHDINKEKYIYNFPTGKGGILYKPEFFHKTKDLIFNKDIFFKTCGTNDDIWFYIVRVKNNIECYLSKNKFMLKDNTKSSTGLFLNFNCTQNTKYLRDTFRETKLFT
jgi:hypothetical protein